MATGSTDGDKEFGVKKRIKINFLVFFYFCFRTPEFEVK